MSRTPAVSITAAVAVVVCVSVVVGASPAAAATAPLAAGPAGDTATSVGGGTALAAAGEHTATLRDASLRTSVDRRRSDRQATESRTLAATYTFERTDEPDRVALGLRYDLPSEVTAFRVRLPELAGSSVSVVDYDGFDRRDETTFEWTGATSTATLDLRLSVATDEITPTSRGVARDNWTFATVPGTEVDISYVGSRPRFTPTTAVAGSGYGADRMAIMGAYGTVEQQNGEEEVTFVVGNGTAAANVSSATRFLDLARGRFDFGVRRDRLVVFVLPYEGRTPADGQPTVTGEAFGDAVWVTADATAVEGPTNAFAHEYVHSRLGDTGNGSAMWLTEATAEYYGSLTTLNAGGSSYEDFTEATRAPRFGPNRTAVVLSDPETWRGTLGNYEKGAHVLAALDAEIRERTDGETTLYDVFLTARTFDDYAAFRTAVVETSGDDSLGGWLDRYVTTTALPPLPEEPAYAVHGAELDPDADGLTSEEELSGSPSTNPFRADTDGDTLPDGQELRVGTDPTLKDTDGDGANDAIDAYPLDASAPRPDERDFDESVERETATSPPGDLFEHDAGDVDERDTAENAGETDAVRTVAETPGFGVGVAVAAITLAGMLRRRQNRESV